MGRPEGQKSNFSENGGGMRNERATRRQRRGGGNLLSVPWRRAISCLGNDGRNKSTKRRKKILQEEVADIETSRGA